MTDSPYAIHHETDKTGSTVYLYLCGQFDVTAHRALGRALREILHRSRTINVVIDVAKAETLDGECIDLLLVGYARALRSGHGYQVINGQGPVRQILEATSLCARLDDVLYAPTWIDDASLARTFAGGSIGQGLLAQERR
jgi:anti-anti-sigma regulatory factor